MDDLRAQGARVGLVTGSASVEPTARVKWTDIRVDPDGFVWLEPWRPHSMRDHPMDAWVIHPATGAVRIVTIDRFPGSFLPDESFVSLSLHPTLRIPVVRKYGAG